MSDVDTSTVAVLVGLGVAIGLRVLDALLPKGHHFRFMDRWIVDDDDDLPGPEDEEG